MINLVLISSVRMKNSENSRSTSSQSGGGPVVFDKQIFSVVFKEILTLHLLVARAGRRFDRNIRGSDVLHDRYLILLGVKIKHPACNRSSAPRLANPFPSPNSSHSGAIGVSL